MDSNLTFLARKLIIIKEATVEITLAQPMISSSSSPCHRQCWTSNHNQPRRRRTETLQARGESIIKLNLTWIRQKVISMVARFHLSTIHKMINHWFINQKLVGIANSIKKNVEQESSERSRWFNSKKDISLPIINRTSIFLTKMYFHHLDRKRKTPKDHHQKAWVIAVHILT